MSAFNFRPSRHGFRFTNSYDLRDVVDAMPGITPPFIKNAILDAAPQNGYGLCGGMCHAAYDYFLADRRIPRRSRPPRPPSRLYRYIRRRQINSFGRFPIAKPFFRVFKWMRASNRALEKRTDEQRRALMARLTTGRAGHLYLIRVRDGQDPWENHQVMAYGMPEFRPEEDAVLFSIYDPNYEKNDDVCLKVTLRNGRARCEQLVDGNVAEDEPVRGFFLSPYRRKRPPRN